MLGDSICVCLVKCCVAIRFSGAESELQMRLEFFWRWQTVWEQQFWAQFRNWNKFEGVEIGGVLSSGRFSFLYFFLLSFFFLRTFRRQWPSLKKMCEGPPKPWLRTVEPFFLSFFFSFPRTARQQSLNRFLAMAKS